MGSSRVRLRELGEGVGQRRSEGPIEVDDRTIALLFRLGKPHGV